MTDDAGADVTTNEDPHGNNTEGNGLTGTSGGEYFVDEPSTSTCNATLPAGTTDVRFRYSTDAAYLDTGWFVDDVQVGRCAGDGLAPMARVVPDDGAQNNDWPCRWCRGAT